MDLRSDHDGVEGLIDPTATLQDRGEEAALADLRDLEGEIPGLRGDLPGSGSIPPGRPRQAPLMRLGADVVGGLGIDQGLVEEGHHLAHQIEIGALMNSIRERGQVKLLMGHRSISLSCLLKGHAENAPMARLLRGPPKCHHFRGRQLLRAGERIEYRRPKEGKVFVAGLTPEGNIQMEDGRTFSSLSRAAATLAGVGALPDWEVWLAPERGGRRLMDIRDEFLASVSKEDR